MIPASSTNKNKPQRNRLNNCAPKIDPCGTPWNISRYELKLDLVLNLCFLPVRQSNIKLSALISKFSASSFTTRMSCVLQSNAFDKSVKRVPNVPPLLSIF